MIELSIDKIRCQKSQCDRISLYARVMGSILCLSGIRYNHKDGEVKITLSHKDDYAITEIQDTGIDIAVKKES